jgi:RNA polymerase sigma-70 factor (ECF subfamily)
VQSGAGVAVLERADRVESRVAGGARAGAIDDVATVALLATMARDGDRAAYGELYRRLSPAIAAVARRRVSDPEIVADVIQDTFVKAFERMHQVRDLERFPAWLAGIARNTARDALRARYASLVEPGADLTELGDVRPGPDRCVESRHELRGVLAGIALLSPGDALAVTLVAHLGLSTEELASVLGIAPVAAKVRLHRARRRLAALVSLPG